MNKSEPIIDAELEKKSNNRSNPIVDILIISCRRDVRYTFYCLQSILQFCKNFRKVVLAVPDVDVTIFDELRADLVGNQNDFPIVITTFHEPAGKGMLMCDILKMKGDFLCKGSDYVLITDSDCVFTDYVTPFDYMTELGKPVLLIEPFENFREQHPNRYGWKKVTEDAIGGTVEFETCVRHPTVHHTSLFSLFRDAVTEHTKEKFEDYVLRQRNEFPQTFNEMTTMGALVLRHFKDQYHIIDVSKEERPKDKLHQGWTHGGITTKDLLVYEKAGLVIQDLEKTPNQDRVDTRWFAQWVLELEPGQRTMDPERFKDLAMIPGEDGRQDTQEIWHKTVAHYLNNLTLLDVGSGMCAAKWRMNIRGLTITTQEPCPDSLADIKADVSKIPTKSYDAVSAFDVIEHVGHPMKFLQELARIAKHYIIISTPNFLRPGGGDYDRHWFEWTPKQFMQMVGPDVFFHGWVFEDSKGIFPVGYEQLIANRTCGSFCVVLRVNVPTAASK